MTTRSVVKCSSGQRPEPEREGEREAGNATPMLPTRLYSNVLRYYGGDNDRGGDVGLPLSAAASVLTHLSGR